MCIFQLTNDMEYLIEEYNIYSDLYICRNHPTDCTQRIRFKDLLRKVLKVSVKMTVQGKCDRRDVDVPLYDTH